MRSRALFILAVASILGCGGRQASSLHPDHPANPRAAGTASRSAPTLAADRYDRPVTEAPTAREHPSRQTTNAPPDSASEKSTYVCPMHPEVVSDKPGECPKCGMALVPMEKK